MGFAQAKRAAPAQTAASRVGVAPQRRRGAPAGVPRYLGGSGVALARPAQSVQRKGCGAGCGGTCATCAGEPDLESPRGDRQRKPLRSEPARDPAERQADEIGARIAADLDGVPVGDGALSEQAQRLAERHLGVSLAGTRLIGGAAGHERATREHALAVTEGTAVSFRRDRLTSRTPEGRALIGHELTHVAQQRAHAPGATAPQRFPSLEDLENFGGALGDLAEGTVEGAYEVGAGAVRGVGEVASGAYHGAGEVASGAYHGAGELASGAYHGVGELASGIWHGDPLGGLERGAGEVAGGFERGAGEVVGGVERGIGEVGGGLYRGAGELLGGLESGATAFGAGLQSALERYGIHVELTDEGLVIEIDDIELIDSVDTPIIPGPDLFWFFPFHPPVGWMVGPIPMAGVVGLMLRFHPDLMGTLGPGLIRNIRVVLNPFGTSYAHGELYLAAALGPRLVISGAISGLLGTIIPSDPPLPIIAGVEGGLRGTGRASALGSIGIPITLTYSGGRVTLDIEPTIQLALHLMADLDAYAAVSLYGRIMCEYVWNLIHWEGGPAGQVSLPIHIGFDGWRPRVDIGDFDWGWIPIDDIDHAIEGTTPGWNCDGWERFKEELCEEGVLPPELCEDQEEEPDLDEEPEEPEEPEIGPTAGLSYPGDCNRNTLLRYARRCGLTIEEGGKHTKVLRSDGTLVTLIPRTVKPNNTCRSIIRDLVNECEGGASAARTYKCTTKCSLQSTDGGTTPCNGHVTGAGSGKTEPAACKAAKKDASSKAPRNCKTKHCNPCDCNR